MMKLPDTVQGFADFLDGCENVDEGVETVMTIQAFAAIMGIIKSLYGEACATMVEGFFTQREDGSLVMSEGNASDKFLDFLAPWRHIKS